MIIRFFQLSGNPQFSLKIEILSKTKKLKDELKQSQLQLIDLPLVEFDPRYTQEDAEKYFNNPKVNKKYKMKFR